MEGVQLVTFSGYTVVSPPYNTEDLWQLAIVFITVIMFVTLFGVAAVNMNTPKSCSLPKPRSSQKPVIG